MRFKWFRLKSRHQKALIRMIDTISNEKPDFTAEPKVKSSKKDGMQYE